MGRASLEGEIRSLALNMLTLRYQLGNETCKWGRQVGSLDTQKSEVRQCFKQCTWTTLYSVLCRAGLATSQHEVNRHGFSTTLKR